jgi:hypothetical protein
MLEESHHLVERVAESIMYYDVDDEADVVG